MVHALFRYLLNYLKLSVGSTQQNCAGDCCKFSISTNTPKKIRCHKKERGGGLEGKKFKAYLLFPGYSKWLKIHYRCDSAVEVDQVCFSFKIIML